ASELLSPCDERDECCLPGLLLAWCVGDRECLAWCRFLLVALEPACVWLLRAATSFLRFSSASSASSRFFAAASRDFSEASPDSAVCAPSGASDAPPAPAPSFPPLPPPQPSSTPVPLSASSAHSASRGRLRDLREWL